MRLMQVAEEARLELASLLGRQISNLLDYQLSYPSVQGLLNDLCGEGAFVNVSEPADFDQAPDCDRRIKSRNDIVQDHAIAGVATIERAGGIRLENVKDAER
jgi:hypothetical protein